MTGPNRAYDGFSGYNRYSSQPLLLEPRIDTLDLTAAIGQRQSTYRFDLVNGVTGQNLGSITPYRDQPATITHDTSRTIKRDLKIVIDAVDLAEINTLTDRILPFMLIAGQEWQLGRYMFVAETDAIRTGGDDGSMVLMDEMNLVDQELLASFSSTASCDAAMRELVEGLPLPMGTDFAATPYPASGAWRMGARRGQALGTLALLGDLETPWMNNTGVMCAVRTVDPATSIPDLSFDDGYPVHTDSIMRTDDLLMAPNRFVVVGNGSDSSSAEIVGRYDTPPSAPHSIASRGFAIQQTTTLDIATSEQAKAAARAIGIRSVPVEQVDLTTAPDPRHDGFQVVRWRGNNYLETAWSLNLIEGGEMAHTLRRAYL